MPEHLRALAVILILAVVVFAFAKVPACAIASTAGDFERRRNLWFALTLTAFLAGNFWVYIMLAAAILLLAMPREPNKVAMFYVLLFAVPAVRNEIPGLGIVNQVFSVDYLRVLALAVLLPAYLHLRRQPGTIPFGRPLPDKFLAGFLVLQFLLMLPGNSLTHALRQGAFYPFLSVFLPYYVASRSLKNLQDFRDALMGFVIAAMVLSAIGVFEYGKDWLLYSGVDEALGVQWEFGGSMQRGGGVRAIASAGTAVILGYVVAVAIGFFLFLRRSIANPAVWGLGLLLLIVGLLANVSRGPWVGAAAIVLIFIAAGPSPLRGFLKAGALGLVALPVLLATPAGEKLIDLVPFIGAEEQFNVTYRERLAQISFRIIMENPILGVGDPLRLVEMQELMQGQGIIDLVNTYAAVGLGSGLVGLSLFTGTLIAVAVGIYKGMSGLPARNSEAHLLGRVLLATLLGIMLMIATVSTIMTQPLVNWSVAGLGVAYTYMVAAAKTAARAADAAARTTLRSRTANLGT